MNNRFRRLTLCAALCAGFGGGVSQLHAQADASDLMLHYNRPATYFEEALVIGNGNMGAIVYGGTERDVLSLNDITLWTGEPDRTVTTPDAYKSIPVIRTQGARAL